MLQFGLYKADDCEKAGTRRRFFGARVAYNLLDVGDAPTPEQVARFEDICFTMRLSNGTFKTSYRDRFRDLDARVAALMASSFGPDATLRIEDRAVSHGLTALEWARPLLESFPSAVLEASDLLLYLVELRLQDGTIFIAEPDGTALQAVAPPFVVSLLHREPRRYPLNQLVAAWYRRKFAQLSLPDDWVQHSFHGEMKIRKIPLVHPEVRQFEMVNPRFRVVCRSVFDVSELRCHALRTMNILNKSYFSESRLTEAIMAISKSVVRDGFWILGRTSEDTFENHASILQRTANRWRLVERLGEGSEIESLALSVPLDSLA